MPEDTTNVTTETVSKAEFDKVVAERDSITASNKALQRSYENLRRQGASTADISKRLEANEKLLVPILETLGKLGVEGVDTKPIVEAYKKERESAEIVDGVKAAASEAIVAAFEAAGIDETAFDTTWNDDTRFDKARTLFNSGKYADAAREAISAVAKPVKTVTDDDVRRMVDEAVAKDRQTRAAVVDPGKQTSGAADAAFTDEQFSAWLKKPAEERLKDYTKAKEFMRRG